MVRSTFSIPWEKYGLITELTGLGQQYSPQFGKTALQKLVYLLQEVYNVPVGYEFNLHTYGPFSAELLSDLDYVAFLDGIEIDWVASGGYSISEGNKAQDVRERAGEFLAKYKEQICSIVNEFGNLTAKELELRSTLIFVQKQAMKQGETISDKDLTRYVHEIKPHFSMPAIESAVEELKSKRLLL